MVEVLIGANATARVLPAHPRVQPDLPSFARFPGAAPILAQERGQIRSFWIKDKMRSSKSRSRSKANRPRTLGNIINRVFDSSGPEGKVRGTPQQIIEKYLILARDAQLSNDRVAAENFLQHAEHYTRLLGEAQREMAAEQEARQQQFQPNGQNRDQNRDQFGRDQNRDQNRDRRDGGDYRDQREPRPDQRPDTPRHEFTQGSGMVPILSGADVIDLTCDDDAGLVETPEAARDEPPAAEPPAPRPERAPRAERAPKPAPAAAEDSAEEKSGDKDEEKADRPRRSRGPRKPKAETPAETKPEAAE